MERFIEDQRKPTAADNFRSMVRIIRESQDTVEVSECRSLKKNARELAVKTLNASGQERDQLQHAINMALLLSPDLKIEIYRILLDTRIKRAVEIRDLLGFRRYGPLPTVNRQSAY